MRPSRTLSLCLSSALGLLISLTGWSGCWVPPEPTTEELELGLVYMFPGIEGGPTTLKVPYDALRAGGMEAAVRVHDPARPLGLITNLIGWDQNHADAQRIADEVAEYHANWPDAPIDLIGYSGGGAMVVLVAEQLPVDVTVRNALLLAPALSPDYDLTPALQNITGKLVNFHSSRDTFWLDVFTRTFGTMDRNFVTSAGKNGFDLDAAVPDAELRAHVEQLGWNEKWAAAGHWGGHVAIFVPEWNRLFVAPYLQPEPTDTAEDQTATSQPAASAD